MPRLEMEPEVGGVVGVGKLVVAQVAAHGVALPVEEAPHGGARLALAFGARRRVQVPGVSVWLKAVDPFLGWASSLQNKIPPQ